MTSFQTPKLQTQGTEATHKAVAHWRGQRISAVALISLGIWFLLEILRHTQADYPLVLAWASQPWVGIALALLVNILFLKVFGGSCKSRRVTAWIHVLVSRSTRTHDGAIFGFMASRRLMTVHLANFEAMKSKWPEP